MTQALLAVFIVLNRILDAGNAVTAFSLLLYALTFNLRERVARAFALVLGCVSIVYFGDVLTGTALSDGERELWLRFQWLAISFLPATYLHLSDALLASTGRPSRGRRRRVVKLSYGLSAAFWAAAVYGESLAGGLVSLASAHYLRAGPFFAVYCGYFLLCLVLSGINYARAYQRCLTRTSRRRMRYLITGSMGPPLATFPFMMIGGTLAGVQPLAFWALLGALTGFVGVLLLVMAYAIAYFGVSYTDRVVKSRLFQWFLRGPVVASTVLGITVVVNRMGLLVGLENSQAVPFAMVATLLVLQYLITLIRPPIERWLFYGQDRNEVARLHLLEERLLTTGDLRQYFESILNAACDITGSQSAFVAALGANGLELEVSVGPESPLRSREELPTMLMADKRRDYEVLGPVFVWDSYWLVPLRIAGSTTVLGLLGLRARSPDPDLRTEEVEALAILKERATDALTNRVLQKEVFSAVDRLVPEVEAVQRMRAAARYGGAKALTTQASPVDVEVDLVHWVRDALGHYWGGPRLAESPLLGLRIVKMAIGKHNGNPVNALRGILREGIDRIKPEGERRFTAEWMLYNILEMKFLEGRKVRDVALRLAMSEADLYRKQRVAIDAVAREIVHMEQEATTEAPAAPAKE